jgi:hypothetical protein
VEEYQMTDRELMQMALDALILNNREWEELAEQSGRWKAEDQDHYHHTELTIKALRDRLAQFEPEPVCEKIPQECWSVRCQLGMVCKNTAPPKREWVGLTTEEIDDLYKTEYFNIHYDLPRAVEALLKEKNT